MTPDMQDRIERAAREISWDGEPTRADLSLAGRALRLAFPELFDTPTHWIAPWELSDDDMERMADAKQEAIDAFVSGFEAKHGRKPQASGAPAVWLRSVWTSMRTAYLNQKDSEG